MTLSEDAAEAYVAQAAFRAGPPRFIGVELEWFVHDVTDPSRPVSAETITAALDRAGPPVLDGVLSTEPGAQQELSTRPADSLDECLDRGRADMATLRAAFGESGLHLAGFGLDPYRSPRRHLSLPRYEAMQEYFDRTGDAGRTMMCSTASVQISVDAGTADTLARRWRLGHALAPVLVAAFANSPLREGRPTGWRCTRQEIWSRIDRTRTAPPSVDGDPRAAWAAYALDAYVLCVRDSGPRWLTPDRLTFRDWIRGEGPGRPTLEDLTYHLTTLFPPVRPKGFVELRYIDAQSGDGWVVPVAIVAALFGDDKAGDAALDACEPVLSDLRQAVLRAARDGLSDPTLAGAAREVFDAAAAALARLGASALTQATVADFTDRYVDRARSPADDLL